jgi:hypothetical protein
LSGYFFPQSCHFDEGEILVRSSTKIGFSLRSYLRGFLLRRNDKNCAKLCELFVLILQGLPKKNFAFFAVNLLQKLRKIRFKIIRPFHYFSVFSVNWLSVFAKFTHITTLDFIKNSFDFILQTVFDNGSA